MELYDEIINSVSNGSVFNVDLKKKVLQLDKNNVPLDNMSVNISSSEDMLSTIHKLFERYKYSVPSERSEGKRRRYFKALKLSEIDYDDFMFGEGRDTAQIKLELYVLLSSIYYKNFWEEIFKEHFFYQSDKDRDLIILKDWVC